MTALVVAIKAVSAVLIAYATVLVFRELRRADRDQGRIVEGRGPRRI